MRRLLTSAALLALLGTTACAGDDDGVGEVPGAASTTSGSPDPSPSPAPESTVVPELAVEEVAGGFEHGWDIGFLPDGRVLVTERPARISLVAGTEPGSEVTRVEADLDDVYVQGEGGLMGMVVHPDFETSREFTTCQTHTDSAGAPDDIRLVTWRLSEDGASAERVTDLLTGLPISTGRHSGCRPEIAADGALLVGTGDTAVGSLPQDLSSLGGKVIRLDLESGQPLPDNPFADESGMQRYVYSYGHRNLQGVAVQPGTGAVYTAEHGPSNNDEVNLVEAGANYGWDPAQGGTVGGYDESVPMTDRDRYPDAVPAVWQSGRTTQAVCSAEFLEGEQWGALDGALVVTALKGAKLLVMQLDDDGALAEVSVPEATNGPYGRLRAARLGPDGALYVTTTNGDDDRLLKVTPRT